MGKELQDARAALCDLLIGRMLRLQAAETLMRAIGHAELAFTDSSDGYLDAAAHMEWLAGLAEQGKVRWGGRLNRCGYQPRETEE